MNYTRNHHRNLLQKNCAEDCVLLSFQSFPCAIKRCVNDVLFFQGCFDKIQGLLGKIQGLFKDLNKFFNFQGLFKGLMLFQGLFKARANHDVKSTSQQPVQNSVALENYLEETKLEIASAIFHPQIDNISANEKNAITALRCNSKITHKIADKRTKTIILNTAHKIDEGLQQYCLMTSFTSLSHLLLCKTPPEK